MIIIKKFFLCLLMLLSTSSFFSQNKFIPYQELPSSSGGSGSGIFFSAAMSPTSFTVTFEGPSNRWIALGLGTAMFNTDVLIYSNGQFGNIHPLSWRDYYNTSQSGSGVNNDVSQDWTIVSSNVVASQRTVTATRALSTGDPNDVAVNYNSSALNLVWAKGATADYTIAYHGSNNRATNISLAWLSQPTASFTANTTTVCAGSSVTFSNQSQGGQTTYTWTFASGTPATSTATNPVVIYSTPGTYSVNLVASNAVGSGTFSQTNYITVTPTVAPTLSISQIAGTNPLCAGTSVTFFATSVNGGSSPSYQWRVNGSVAGTNSSTFTSNSLTNGAIVTCILTSNMTCASPATFTSSAITMTVNSTAPAAVSILQSSGANPSCTGATLAFTATPVNGGSSPFYQWKVNGINVGSNLPTFSASNFVNGDIVTVVLNSSSSCASNTVGTSSGITLTVSSVLTPSITISQISGTNPMCTGTPATFSASFVNGGSNPVFQWQINSGTISGNTPTLSLTGPYSGTVACWMLPNLSCTSASLVMSPALSITIHPTPVVTISPTGSVAVCSDAVLIVSGSGSNGMLWSTGATTQSISVSQSGVYSYTQTLNGCPGVSPAFTVVSVTQPTAVLSAPDNICKDAPSFTLLGQPAGGVYSGNGVTGNSFNPSQIIGSSVVVYKVEALLGNTVVCTDTASTRIFVYDCTGINESKLLKNPVTVYPNPSSGEFIVSTTSQKIKSFRVYDINGKIILEKANVNAIKSTVDLREYSKGIYLMEIEMDSQVIRTRLYKTD